VRLAKPFRDAHVSRVQMTFENYDRCCRWI
jgi:hypothetical protein